MSKPIKVDDQVHYGIRVAAAKQGVTMGSLLEQRLRLGDIAPMLAAAANRFCDEVPDYRGRIDHSMISQFGEMQRVFEDAVNAYDEAMNPEGDGDG